MKIFNDFASFDLTTALGVLYTGIMKRVIQIKHTKGIENLTFPLPQQCGVYLLVGANGCGKTSILTCLHQLCYRDAFKEGFSTAAENDEVDRYSQSEIIYTGANGQSVTYGKKGKMEQRWKPTGTNGLAKQVLSSFGFSAAVFIKADHTRLTPSEAEIKKGEYVPASKEVKDALNFIFSEEKYSHLKRLKVKNGRGKNASLFYVIQDAKRNYFYSEKRFSTGELAMLNLVEKLVKAKENTLVLLDEAELALHPKVQINLLRYLNTIAAEKKLTVFVSTHSPTMIRSTYPTKIMLLNQTEMRGYYEIVTPCHPAYAIGFVEESSFSSPDGIICVEDEMAEMILKALLKLYLNSCGNASLQRLDFQIIPIGGYVQTMDFVKRAEKQLFHQTRICAVLDHDVFDGSEKKQELIAQLPGQVFDLGITPEFAFIGAIEELPVSFLSALRQEFCIHQESLAAFVKSHFYQQACKKEKPSRSEIAKDKFKAFVNFIAKHTSEDAPAITKTVISLLIPILYSEKDIRRYSAPIIAALIKR